MQKKNNIFFVALLVAFPLAILFAVLLPIKHERFKAQVIERNNIVGFNSKHYVDWDNDGYSEFIYLTENIIGNAAIKTYTHNGNLIEQHNLNSKFINEFPIPFFDDYDDDGYIEAFILTQINDSLFINSFDLQEQIFITYHKFVCKVPVVNGVNDFSAAIFNAVDANGDGINEIYINVNAGFSLQPRRFYRFEIENNKIIKSPVSYSKVGSNVLFDIDEDGEKEFLCINTTTYNYTDTLSVPFPDSTNWLFIFNPDLKFKIIPRSFDGATSMLKSFPLKLSNGYGIVTLYSKRAAGKLDDFLMLMDNKGNELKKLILPSTKNNKSHNLIPTSIKYESFLLILSDGSKYYIDKSFNLDKKLKRDNFINYSYFRLIDLYKMDKVFLLINLHENNIAVSTLDLKHISKLNIPFKDLWTYSVRKNGNDAQIYFQDTSTSYLFSYRKNRFYYLEFLIYPGIYLLLIWLAYLVLNSQQKKIVRQYETEKRLSELQFQNVKSQLNPHFTFNVLNSIGRMVKSGDSEMAYDYLSKNAKMLRSLMQDADEVTRPLKKEIEFVKDYLSLQKLRFKDRYQFLIDFDENINTKISVPKMIIHTYVENALKHGLSEVKSDGILTVNVAKTSDSIFVFTITDNGTGFNQDKVKFNEGKGIKIMEEYFRLFQEYYGYKINVHIISLQPENKLRPGTQVQIELQLPN